MQYDRQIDFFDPSRKENLIPVIVVGAGTIGSWTVLGLAKLGIKDISVFDFDKVEHHNCPNQFYSEKDSGLPKVVALETEIRRLSCAILSNSQCFSFSHTRFPPTMVSQPFMTPNKFILVSAVDSMKSRKEIWEWVKLNQSKVLCLIDGRMGGEVVRVFTAFPMLPSSCEEYEKSLYDDDSQVQNPDAQRLGDVPCTARSIVDVSFVVSGIIINYVRRFITGKTLKIETIVDMRNGLSF